MPKLTVGRRVFEYDRQTVFAIEIGLINSHYNYVVEVVGAGMVALAIYNERQVSPGQKKRLLMRGERRSHVLAREVNRGGKP